MTEIEIEISSEIFNPAYRPYRKAPHRTQIFFGGSSSGKSVFLAQRAIYDVLNGRNYLIVRNTANTIRSSTFNEIRKVIGDWGLTSVFSINKSEMTITADNRAQILFKGLDDAEKIKSVTPESGVMTDIWVEEATECAEDDIKQLEKRLRGKSKFPKRLTLSFNPILKTHWIFKKYFAGFYDGDTIRQTDDLLILKPTYKDNRFLEPDDIAALENETDPYWREVYTLGNWGILGDVIFTNWRVEDLPDRKFIVFTYGSSDNPYGNGLGQKLWWPMWFKKNGIKFWLVFLEKYGMPTALGKYPPGTPPDQQAALLDALDAIQNETGIKIPETKAIELIEASRQGTATYGEMCEYIVHANKVYARIHHEGGKAGRGRKVNIPARPFIMVQDEDWAEIKDALNNYIFGSQLNG